MFSELQVRIDEVLGDVELTQENQGDVVLGRVKTPRQHVDLTLAWNRHSEFLAGEVTRCQRQRLPEVLRLCNTLGAQLGCTSVYFPQMAMWQAFEEQGYRKQYIYPLKESAAAVVDFQRLRACAWDFRSFLRTLFNIPIRWRVSVDERPFIYSLDWEASTSGVRFSCYVHVHPLSQAAYLEELRIPKRLRKQGMGSRIVRFLRKILAAINCRYLYLRARRQAEGFWERLGFAYLLRANLRKERRRTNALRRCPGWDRTVVAGERLANPHWFYRNHPQDDLDLFRALSQWPLESVLPVSLTV